MILRFIEVKPGFIASFRQPRLKKGLDFWFVSQIQGVLFAGQSQRRVMQKASSLQTPRAPSPVSGLVYKALVKMLGREKAEVLDFYIDSRLAAEDPEGYEHALESLLGEQGGRLVVRALISDLRKAARTGGDFSGSFLNQVRMAEKALAHREGLGRIMTGPHA